MGRYTKDMGESLTSLPNTQRERHIRAAPIFNPPGIGIPVRVFRCPISFEEHEMPTTLIITLKTDGRIDSLELLDSNNFTESLIQKRFDQAKETAQGVSKTSTAHLSLMIDDDGQHHHLEGSQPMAVLPGLAINYSPNLSDSHPGDSSELGDEVTLDPKDERFKIDIARLKKLGYTFESDRKVWTKSPNGTAPDFTNWYGNARKIGLLDGDPDFQEKHSELVAAGFLFNDESNLWERPQL